MKLYAQVENDKVTNVAYPPTSAGVGPDGFLRDYSRPEEVEEYLSSGGWLEVAETAKPEDTAMTYFELKYVLNNGVPTQAWEEKNKTMAQVKEEVLTSSSLGDLEARISRIEAFLWPAQPDPTEEEAGDVKTFTDWDGVVPAGSLVKEADGKVYRNVSGVPLTTPPSGMPGAISMWTHLWLQVAGGTSNPPTGTAPNWTDGVAYKIDDRVTFEGKRYKCIQAHTSLPGWTPTVVPALWAVV